MRNIAICLYILLTMMQPQFLKGDGISEPKKVIYVFSDQSVPDIFAIDNPHYNRDHALEPVYRLREEAFIAGFELKQIHSLQSLHDFEYLIVFNIPITQSHYLAQYPKEKLILFLWEPPSVLPQNYNPKNHEYFSKIFTWNDELVDNKKYFKFYYPSLNGMISNPVSFDKKKLCTLIACNKYSSHSNELYSERSRVIAFFEAHHAADFDLYGKGWPASSIYKGEIERKVDYLKLYKFAIAYENIKGIPGYVTEKIFDCFQAGCVPVYLGASNVQMYIPKECYIAREDFVSDEALYEFLSKMTEAQYQQYITSIQKFLVSDQAKVFSTDMFIKIVMEHF